MQAHPGYNNNNGYWYHPENSSLGGPGVVVTERKTVDGYLYYIARRDYVGQNTTVYAHYYNPKTFQLTLNANGGSWGEQTSQVDVTYWTSVTIN